MDEANDIEVMYRSGNVVLGKRAGRVCACQQSPEGEWEVEEFSDLIQAFRVYAKAAHPDAQETPVVEAPPKPSFHSFHLRRAGAGGDTVEDMWVEIEFDPKQPSRPWKLCYIDMNGRAFDQRSFEDMKVAEIEAHARVSTLKQQGYEMVEKTTEKLVRSKGSSEEEVGEGGGLHVEPAPEDPPCYPCPPGGTRWMMKKPERELAMVVYEDRSVSGPKWKLRVFKIPRSPSGLSTLYQAALYTRKGAMAAANKKASHYKEKGYRVSKETVK